MTPRAITGAGVVSAIGIGRRAFFEGLPGSTSLIQSAGPLRALAATGFDPVAHLGERGLRALDRLSKLVISAGRLALHDAGLKKDGFWVLPPSGAPSPSERVGAVVSNAYGSIEAISELDRVKILEDARYINPSRFPLTVSNSPAGYLGIWEELHAPNVTVSGGQCGGLDAFGCADLMLADARASALLVGGAEALSDGLSAALSRIVGSASTAFQVGEGAAFVVLEPKHVALARGAAALAEIIGYGASFAPPAHDAQLLVAAPDPLVRAIDLALVDAGARPDDIDGVVVGASGLAPFDAAEYAAVDLAMKGRSDAIGLIAPKAVLGETFGAAGALGVLVAAAALQGAFAPAMLRRQLRSEPRTMLVTSLSYYGAASAVILARG